MASSSRGRAGADEVATEIPEDLVLSWTRDATTINTCGALAEDDRQLLKELIQCVHKEKDTNATKQKLWVLLGRGKDRKSVVIRARVLTRLIAIALGLHPDDITIDSETGKESLRSSVDLKTTIHSRLVEALQHDNSILSYLFKDALEADDEVMTVMLCDPRNFEKYPVPYFHGCDLAVVQEISKLWLSQEFRRGFYFRTVLEPVVNQVKAEGRPSKISEEFRPSKTMKENILEATMMLCELLQRRTVKAGARLLEAILAFQNDFVREAVEGLVIPLVRLKTGKFRKCFFGDFENRAREVRWHSRGSDELPGRHGQSIIVGPSSAQTDSNLLCWAARRGYSFLIWCISLGYTEARQMRPEENLLEDATEALAVSLLWKVALWCATRHGRNEVIIKLMYPPWVKSINFNDYSGIEQCLPPLHLVSLLGDRSLLSWLCTCEVGTKSGAYKTDYLGKTPLDYAMQFQLMTRNSKEGVNITNDIKDKMQFQPSTYENKEWLQPVARYPTAGPEYYTYDTRRVQYPPNYNKGMPLRYSTARPGYTTYDTRPGYTTYDTRPEYTTYDIRPGYTTYDTRPGYTTYDTRLMHYPPNYNEGMPMSTMGHQSCIRQLLQMPGVADRLKELNDMYTTQANFVLVGATLIASVAFSGWLQPPLGYRDYFQFTPHSPLAPTGTYEQYVAVEGHLSVQIFVVFNALSFFLGIGTMLIGAEATLFIHDNDERTIALMKVRKSIKWMLGFFIASMMCIMAAFICAGLAILPPIQRLEWSMIFSLCFGACICLIPLTWILFSLARDQIVKVKDEMIKLIMSFDKEKKLDYSLKHLGGSLVNEKDMETLQDEKERKCCEQQDTKPNSPYTDLNSPGTDFNSPRTDLNSSRTDLNSPYRDRTYGVILYGARLYGDKLYGDTLVVRSPRTLQRRHSWA